MWEKQSGTLRAVAWSEMCPWLVIFRTFRLAVSFRVLALGAVAILLTALVWGLFGWAFSPSAHSPVTAWTEPVAAWTEPYARCPWEAVTDALVPDTPWPLADAGAASFAAPAAGNWAEGNPVVRCWAELSRPLWAIFTLRAEAKDLACLLLCGLSSLAIWAFFGAAITRIAAVQLAADERVGWMAALRFACRKWLSYCGAPLLPLLGMALAALPVWVISWALRADVGVFLVGFGWPVLLVCGLIMALLLLGLIFGWPLMWATISAEGTDSFDALNRAYAYVYHRPVHYLFYAILAAVFGWLGWLLVQNFAAGVVWLTYWAASWSAGTDQIELIMPGSQYPAGIGHAGAIVIRFWAGCVKLLAVGFIYGYFWTAATAIYFLLRRDEDATEMDEVFLDADQSEHSAPLPPLQTDAAGAPVVAEPPPPPPPETPAEPGGGPKTSP
jgi:hypothetical protein